MGIWATLLDENDERVGNWFSKAVFSFCAEALHAYCRRGEMSHSERENYVEILEWFPQIANMMTTPLCLLNQATEEPWKYRKDEYEYYLLDLQPILLAWPNISPMTLEEFEAQCDDPLDPYLGTKQMYGIVQDLLLALKNIKPHTTYWYNEEDTWPGFEQLLETLKTAQKAGIQKVRFGYG